jgi:hypothetical protein
MSSACLFLFSAQGLGFLFRLWHWLKLWLQFDDHHVNSIGICERRINAVPRSLCWNSLSSFTPIEKSLTFLLFYPDIHLILHVIILQGHKEWLAEVHFLGLVDSPYLVKLIGYCASDDDERGIQRLLVYEYMPNKGLDDHLFLPGCRPLSWPQRVKIALGAARGLAYLHEEMEIQVSASDMLLAWVSVISIASLSMCKDVLFLL